MRRRTVGRLDGWTVQAKRREIGVQQRHWSEIHVQIEPEPKPQQDVTCMFVSGNPRITERAEENRVYLVAEMIERAFR